MRLRLRAASASSRPTALAGLRVVIAAGVTASLLLAFVPAAVADKGDRAIPSKDEVAAAEQRVADKARDVGAIKASLLLANQRLELAAVEAEKASEAYNGAMWRLDLAKEEVARTRREAAAARRTVAEQRDAIGALVAASYQQGAQLTAVTALVSASGPEDVLDQYATFQGAASSLQADYDRFAATDALAQVFESRAEEARQEQQALAAEARAAKDQAAQAAATAQAIAGQIAAEKDRLIRELAEAQNISVELAQQRQTALEEIARERAAQRARAEAEAAAAEQARKDAAAAVQAAKSAKAAEREERRKKRQQKQSQPKVPSSPAPQPAPQPAPAPPAPPAPPSGSSGADRAVAFAKAQVGESYVWGAAGPDSWDCSGLMLGAWGSAGVYLPHYSAAQYYAGTPISSGNLRAGDLVFWGTTSDPDTIHHVAMYIGDGMIVHAPRTGRAVSIDSMYYWVPPTHFARV